MKHQTVVKYIVGWLRSLQEMQDPKVLAEEIQEMLDLAPITHVAVRLDGVVWSLPKPFRHHHILRVIHDLGVKWNDGEEKDQGFLDASGQYLTRPQARVAAYVNGQIVDNKIIGSVLTSEDLW